MIVNLTQHLASAEQRAAGVVDVAGVIPLLNFGALPSALEIQGRALALASIAVLALEGQPGYRAAMVGGAPYLMAPLQRTLIAAGIEPLYAFSRRESIEVTGAYGAVTKTAVFRHAGFVGAAV